MRDIDEAFQSLDPARGEAKQPDETALERILSTPRQDAQESFRSAPPNRRRWILASVAAVTAAALGLVVTNMFGTASQPAYAVTPAPLKYQVSDRPAAEVLEQIAKRVEKLPGDSTDGDIERFTQVSWSLSTRIDGIQVTSAVIPEKRVTWKKPDGSEKWTVTTQEPVFQTDEQRKVWKDAGSVGSQPQEYSDSSGPADMSDARNHEAPGTPGEMKRWLTLGYESAGPGETFDSVSERLLDRSFAPKQRAALLRALKNTSGIEYRGKVKDRSGRTGEAFSVESTYGGLPTEHTLLFDGSSGKLLAYEEELTHQAGKLNVKTPAVILYVNYL